MTNNLHQGFPIPQKDYYKVYVRSITYNQAPYIEDCLNGVAMQQTDFPFVHHVIDDCSTDGEQEVIKTYLNNNCDMENAEYYDNDICSITIAKNKSNPNCTLVAYFLKRNIYKDRKKREEIYSLWRDVCLYEAICEGDDYWIDAKKVQKQFEFLEKNLDYSCVYTPAYKLKGDKYIGTIDSSKCDFKSLLRSNPVSNLTTLVRLSALKKYFEEVNPIDKQWPMGDYPQWLYMAAKYKIGYISDITSVYRVLEESACHFTNLEKYLFFSNVQYQIQTYIISLFFNEDNQKEYIELSKHQYIRECIYKSINYKSKKQAIYFLYNNLATLSLWEIIKFSIKIVL